MKNKVLLSISIILFGILLGVNSVDAKEDTISIPLNGVTIEGNILIPDNTENPKLVVLVAGSGPTDRNGNSQLTSNNSLKLLAEALAENGIASFRYDKRAVAKSVIKNFNEADLRFNHYVNDLAEIIRYLEKNKGFKNISVCGHSEGSLVALAAMKEVKVKSFISIAGAGYPASEILKTQLKTQLPPAMYDQCVIVIDSLDGGHLVKSFPAQLQMLFRKSVQPYLISWFKYDPVELISKAKCPVLIIQGNKDLQVSTENAENLKKANNAAKLVVVDKMNHVLKTIEGEAQENVMSYSNPEIPVNEDLVEELCIFLKEN